MPGRQHHRADPPRGAHRLARLRPFALRLTPVLRERASGLSRRTGEAGLPVAAGLPLPAVAGRAGRVNADDEQLLRGRVYGHDHDDPNPGPLPHRTYAALVGGPLERLLLDITGWRP